MGQAVTDRVLGSVSAELAALAEVVTDGEPAARLRHAADLLGWVCLWMAQNYDGGGRYAAAVAAYVHRPRFLAEGVAAAFGDDDTRSGHAHDRR